MPTAAHPQQILSVPQMVAAEQALIAAGTSVESLMQSAGEGAAEWVWRLSGGGPVTVLCGPGNNGGDGYVIAESLRLRGCDVAVVAPLAPATDAAASARAAYQGAYCDFREGRVFVDCLFGSGLNRPVAGDLAALIEKLYASHKLMIAVDVTSGIDADSGAALGEWKPPHAGVTLALGAWKMAHHLLPARAICGQLRLVDIGINEVPGAAQTVAKPILYAPAVDAHKYTRGLCLVVAGDMPGAVQLSCLAALNGGAGYVKLLSYEALPHTPSELVVDDGNLEDALLAKRAGAVLVGPGLGRSCTSQARLLTVLETGDAPLVLDADALHFLKPEHRDKLAQREAIATPHSAELASLCASFGVTADDQREQAVLVAKASGMVIVAKGPDTIIASPCGKIAIAPPATPWLSVAGTGDVLAGVIASRRATGKPAFDAACEAVWLHGAAARNLTAPFTASDVARAVPAAIRECL